MGRRLLEPALGDVFAIPLPDEDQASGQVVARIDELGSVGCALLDCKHRPREPVPSLRDPIAVLLVTPDLIQRRYWTILENRPIQVSALHFTWEDHREEGWVGVRIYGSGIIREFMEAYHGFHPWDAMADPEFFSSLLLKGRTRPLAAYTTRTRSECEQ